jgi:hypothetical protein
MSYIELVASFYFLGLVSLQISLAHVMLHNLSPRMFPFTEKGEMNRCSFAI